MQAFEEHFAAKLNLCGGKKAFFFFYCFLLPDSACTTYPVQLDGVDPLLPVLRVLGSEVPHAVVHADVQTALVKLVRLKK